MLKHWSCVYKFCKVIKLRKLFSELILNPTSKRSSSREILQCGNKSSVYWARKQFLVLSNQLYVSLLRATSREVKHEL